MFGWAWVNVLQKPLFPRLLAAPGLLHTDRNDGAVTWFPAEKEKKKSIFPGMKLGCSSDRRPPHPTARDRCSPVAAKSQRLLSEGHDGILG